jgi:hypothetical protein
MFVLLQGFGSPIDRKRESNMATLRMVSALWGLVVLLTVPACALGAEPPGDQEPPLLLYLDSDGKRTPIELDKPFELEAHSGKKTAILRAEPYRVFQYAGLSFRYPRGYAFAPNLGNPAMSLWSLNGSDFMIMVQQFPGMRDHAALRQTVMNEMNKGYAGDKIRELDTKLEFNGAILKGRRIEVTLANTLIHQDLFSFSAGEASVVFILQDTPHENGEPSADRIIAEKMLRESLRLPEK